MEEVQSAIVQLQEDKAPGLDNICPSVVKEDKMYQYLHRLFQKWSSSTNMARQHNTTDL